jgi:hypothetical protein
MNREPIKCNFCTMRIGKVLNEEEWENPQYVPDKEFCWYRKEDMCTHNQKR